MRPAAQTPTRDAPALVVFGRDTAGKAHASAFAAGDAELATKAATLMSLRTLTVRTDTERALAARVPAGRVFASGKAFVPFIKADLFAELQVASLNSGLTPLKPATPPKAEGVGKPVEAVAAAGAVPAAVKQPCGWGEIRVGAIVLSSASPGHFDWYECVVLAVGGEDTFTLRYSDYPNEPPFVRRRSEIGLLHPAFIPEPPLPPER